MNEILAVFVDILQHSMSSNYELIHFFLRHFGLHVIKCQQVNLVHLVKLLFIVLPYNFGNYTVVIEKIKTGCA